MESIVTSCSAELDGGLHLNISDTESVVPRPGRYLVAPGGPGGHQSWPDFVTLSTGDTSFTYNEDSLSAILHSESTGHHADLAAAAELAAGPVAGGGGAVRHAPL